MALSIYAAFLAALLVFLSLHVIRARMSSETVLGDGNDLELQRRIRAHANLVEYAPLFLVLLAIAEFNGLNYAYVHGFGGAFVLGRLLHVYSLLVHEQYEKGKIVSKPVYRIYGMQITFACIAFLAIILGIQFVEKSF